MLLPRNGRIVIIDDEINETIPLFKILSKEKIPFSYFSGLRMNELPEIPFSDIRVIFLDIIIGSYNIHDKNIVSNLMGILDRIIDEKNGPYILIIWSKDKPKIKAIITELESCNKNPIQTLDLKKSDYFVRDENLNYIAKPDAVKNINLKLDKLLKNIISLHLLFNWENQILDSSSETVKLISAFYNLDKDWNNNICKIFYTLSKTYAGKTLDYSNMDEIIKNSYLAFNFLFYDQNENLIFNSNYDEIKLTKKNLMNLKDNEIISTINSLILTYKDEHKSVVVPGQVYISEEKSSNLKDFYNHNEFSFEKDKDELLESTNLIKLEISPYCDHLQKKIQVNRFLLGLIWPAEFLDRLKKRTHYIYYSPLLKIQNSKITKKHSLFHLVFDFRHLFTEKKDVQFETLFILRKSFLNEIQSKLVAHINRPGFLYLDSYNNNTKKKLCKKKKTTK